MHIARLRMSSAHTNGCAGPRARSIRRRVWLRNVELILGLPPMSQYHVAATPMFECFTGEFDLSPYAVKPATTDLAKLNRTDGYGARISAELRLADVDEAPDNLFNEIIWKAIKGVDSQKPPPVRRARLVPLSLIASHEEGGK